MTRLMDSCSSAQCYHRLRWWNPSASRSHIGISGEETGRFDTAMTRGNGRWIVVTTRRAFVFRWSVSS